MNQNGASATTGSLTSVADNVWVFEGAPINAAGLQIPVRMTVIRLASGDLLLHSPARYSSSLREELRSFGAKYLVAPNVAHWMFLADWQKIGTGGCDPGSAGPRRA
jgi:hypothetical protein